MIDNGSLILSESAIGEKSIAESKSNHTVHRAALEKCCCAIFWATENRLILSAADVNVRPPNAQEQDMATGKTRTRRTGSRFPQ